MVIYRANEEQMRKYMNEAHNRNKLYAGFYEPDIGNLLTAVAFEPMSEKEGRDFFDGLKLL